jgi:DNA mismatch repair protein MutS
MCIVKEYLDLTKKYKADYGDKTIVLMEVGSFYEVYALINPDGNYNGTNGMGTNGMGTNGMGANANTYIGSNIEEFAKINDMVIAKKSTFVDKLQVVMAGVGTAYADKYIQKMQDHDYTVVIYKQDLINKTSRNLSEIISPGTYFPIDNDYGLSNNMMCIWLHKSKATKSMPCQVIVGIANIDIYTGKTSLFQFQTMYNHSPATYDELERYISAYKPSECLFVANLPERLVDDIIGFVGLEHTKIHKVDTSASAVGASAVGASAVGASAAGASAAGASAAGASAAGASAAGATNMETFAKNAEKQIYQVELFKIFFPHLSSFHEMFPTHYIAIQSFCFILDFVYQHSPNLTKKLNDPIFENYTDRLILSNHSLSQLNIIDDARHTGKCRSVSALLNNCVTTMGKRQFMYNLHYPITNKLALQSSYDMTDHLLQKGETYFLNCRTHLISITDLEKFMRKVVTRKLLPKNLTALATDLTQIESLYAELEGDQVLLNYLKCTVNISAACREIITDLNRVFQLEACRTLTDVTAESMDTCIINRGISPLLDELLKNSRDGTSKLIAIEGYLSTLIQQAEGKKPNNYVKIHETAKGHTTLVCTSRRVALLKATLKQKNSMETTTLHYKSNYSQTTETFEFNLAALEYMTNGSSKTEMIITSKQIREITSSNEDNTLKLNREVNLVFHRYINDFSKFDSTLTAIIKYVTEMDLLQGKAYTAHKYNYCKPILATDEQTKSFFCFTGIRHPLIEHLQTNELYVTNDLALGPSIDDSMSGILLYGTNAVGKTSFIKSVGIAIIMAQAGLYVPCSSFTYAPYLNVFTRILGNDNIFKGLSTFAVEMTELRTILTQADANSLVLGDELCSGTESDSALSIFTAGLEILHARNSTFLFATHFHEINKYEEIAELTRMKMMHMAVHFNKEKNILIYDRKLREGAGESMYGLEVCKALNLPDAFLQRAHDIRMKYKPEKQNVLSLSPTHFNAKKLVGNCELCQRHKASEVHHLQHQKKASTTNEYITTGSQNFHKNHVANLLNICEACHKKIHKSNEEHKVIKTSEGYLLAKL